MSAGVNPVYTGGFTPGLNLTQSEVPLYSTAISTGAGRGRHGKGFIDNIKKGIKFAQDNKIISKGAEKIGAFAKEKGFGKSFRPPNLKKQADYILPEIGEKAGKKTKEKTNIIILPAINSKTMHGGFGGVIGAKKQALTPDQQYGLSRGIKTKVLNF
jgi:hypothetical protein